MSDEIDWDFSSPDDAKASFLGPRISVLRLATRHAIVQGILATTRRQAARYLVHDRNDLADNVSSRLPPSAVAAPAVAGDGWSD